MRVQRKNKSVIQRGLFLTVLAKNRHYSTAQALKQTPAKAAVNQIVDMLLEEVYQAQQNNEIYYNNLKTFWNQLQFLSTSYFQLMEPQEIEVLSVVEEQPQPEQKKSKGVVGPQIIKKSLLKTVKTKDELSIIEESARQSIYEGDRKDRDLLIQKLKKDYAAILHSKYLSESLPIEESRTYFKEKDAPAVDIFRNSLNSSNVKKKLNKVGMRKKENHQASKQKQMTTFYKKSKDYIDKIDPTNSIYKSQVCQTQSMASPKRGSIYRLDSTSFMGGEDSVIVRESNFKEISNTVAPTKEVLTQLGLKFAKEGARLPTIQSGERQQLSQRIDRPAHLKSQTKKLATQTDKKQIRQKNSMSVCVLPKIKKY